MVFCFGPSGCDDNNCLGLASQCFKDVIEYSDIVKTLDYRVNMCFSLEPILTLEILLLLSEGSG